MIKRNIMFLSAVILSVTVLGQIGKLTFKDQGLCDVSNLDDLNQYSFYFESVDSKADVPYYKEYKDEYVKVIGESGYIFTVTPTGKYKMGTSTGMQEVRITGVIRGEKELENQSVWIDGMPGLAYYEEDDRLCLDSFLNYMQEENEYLIFCDAYGPVMLEQLPDSSKYYVTDSIFGYVNITKKEGTGGIVDDNKSYTVGELKDYEFFGTCQEVLDEKQIIKNELVAEYLNSPD